MPGKSTTPIIQVALFGVGKLAFLGVTILLYKSFSTTNIGLFAVIYAIAVILSTVSECGLRGLLVREMARSHDSPETAKRLLAGAVNARLATLLPYLGIGIIVGLVFLPNAQAIVLLLLLTAAWLDSNAFVFRGALRAFDFIILDATIAGISRMVLLALTGLLVWQHQLTLISFSMLFAAVALIDLLATMTLVTIKTGVPLSFGSTTNRTIALVKRGMPFIVLNIIGIIYIRVGILMLGISDSEGGLREAAAFNLSGKIPEGVTFLPIALMNAAIPFFSRNSGQIDSIIPVFRRLELLMGSAAIIISAGLIVFADQFLVLMATPEYLQYTVLFQLYALTVFFTFLQYVYANLLICMDQEQRVARRYAIILVVNIILNLLLIWKFQAIGAAMALLLCEIAAITIDLRFLSKSGVNPAMGTVCKWALAAIICACIGLLLRFIPYPYGLISYWILGGIGGAIILARSQFSEYIFHKKEELAPRQ